MSKHLITALALAVAIIPCAAQAQQPGLETVGRASVIQGATSRADFVCIGKEFTGPGNAEGCPSGRRLQVGEAQQLLDYYAVFNNDQLKRIATLLETLINKEDSVVTSMNTLKTTTEATQTLWRDQAVEFASAMRTTVTDRFNQLPITITQNAAFKAALDTLKTQILEEVDTKIAAARGGAPTPPQPPPAQRRPPSAQQQH